MHAFKPRVLIVGAGISGLTLAHHLLKKHGEHLDLTVLESTSRPGGTVQTVRTQGYLVECGPNGFMGNRKPTWNLIENLGLNGETVTARSASATKFIWHQGMLKKVPQGPISFLFSDLLTWRGKLRVLTEPWTAPRENGAEESLAEFLKRRVGEEAVECLAEPALSGIFAGDVNALSAEATFPKLVAWEQHHGSLTKGLLKRGHLKQSGSPHGSRMRSALLSFKGGMETLSRSVAERLGDRVVLQRRVLGVRTAPGRGFSLDAQDGRGSVHRFSADILVLATPAYITSILVRDLDQAMSDTLKEIPYAPVHVVALGYPEDAADRLNGFGFLVAESERRELMGCIMSSRVFPNGAPKGRVLFRCMMGGARRPDMDYWPEEDLIRSARRELERFLGLRGEPEFVHVIRWPKAIPQYTLGHPGRMSSLNGRLSKFSGLFLAGNAYHGVGINDCIESSEKLTDEISAFIHHADFRSPVSVP